MVLDTAMVLRPIVREQFDGAYGVVGFGDGDDVSVCFERKGKAVAW